MRNVSSKNWTPGITEGEKEGGGDEVEGFTENERKLERGGGANWKTNWSLTSVTNWREVG